MKLITLVPTLALFLAGAATAQNLVTGGDFENPVVSGDPYLIAVTPAGWTGTGDLVVQGYAGAVSSGSGNQWFDLNPSFDAGTGISQSINLNAGTTYNFSFLYNGGGGGSTTSISYSLGSIAETLLAGSVSTAGMSVYSGTLWQTLATTFTPSASGAATLQLTPNGTYSGGFVDNVQISAVPEPETYALMLAGLGAIAAVARRRRKTSASN